MSGQASVDRLDQLNALSEAHLTAANISATASTEAERTIQRIRASAANPTELTYQALAKAQRHFNARLFNGELPEPLITLQRRQRAYGFYSKKRFSTPDSTEFADEIALNPQHFRERATKDVLATLVHEMCHCKQYHDGRPGRRGYHNTEFADLMESVGLMCSDTGEQGGKRTGQNMSHYVVVGGRFDVACSELEWQGFAIPYIERSDCTGRVTDPRRIEADAKKLASKTPYSCGCDHPNRIWGRPRLKVTCDDCKRSFVSERSALVTVGRGTWR